MRRECLDHLLILNEAQVRRVLGEYMAYFNSACINGCSNGSLIRRWRIGLAWGPCAPRLSLGVFIIPTVEQPSGIGTDVTANTELDSIHARRLA